MKAFLGSWAPFVVVYVEGPLQAPLSSDVRETVQQRLVQGQRYILLDLGRLSEIDAAGIGEMLRVYELTLGVGGVLRITNAHGRVRQLLELAGVMELLTADPYKPQLKAG